MHSTIPSLDYALITEDVSALAAQNIPSAHAIFAGDIDVVASGGDDVALVLQDVLQNGSSAVSRLLASSEAVPDVYVSAVACLKGFVRANFAGPPLPRQNVDKSAAAALGLHGLALDGEFASVGTRQAHLLVAARAIFAHGAPIFEKHGFYCAPWWAARTAMAHQAVLSRLTKTLQHDVFHAFARLLGGNSSAAISLRRSRALTESPHKLLVQTKSPAVDNGVLSKCFVSLSDADARSCHVMALIELAYAQLYYHDVESAAKSQRCACNVAGLNVRTFGHLGTRTKHQKSAISQLVAGVFSKVPENERTALVAPLVDFPTEPHTTQDMEGSRESTKICASLEPETEHLERRCTNPLPRNVPVNDSDALGYIKLSGGEEGEESNAVEICSDESVNEYSHEVDNLSPLEQALVLLHGNMELSRSARHQLADEQAAPYVSLVLQSVNSRHGTSSIVQLQALLLRTSLERDRGRYMERSVTQMEAINSFIDAGSAEEIVPGNTQRAELGQEHPVTPALTRYEDSARERTAFVFLTGLTPRWELKKELAVCFGRFGLVKSAMHIFQELELWDELVDCHRLVGNLGAAEALVRKQLSDLDSASKNATITNNAVSSVLAATAKLRRPRLLCVLGDVTRKDTYYMQAWQETEHRFGRAKRSLGRSALDRKEWHAAIAHFREALRLNPLFPEVWFTCGCAALEVNDFEFAATCFTRVVQEDRTNGEAWNNLGRALSELRRPREALTALLEAAKHKRDSWRIWDNVLTQATHCRASADIVRALDKLLQLRGRDGVNAHAITVAVDEIVKAGLGESGLAPNKSELQRTDERLAASHACRDLMKVLARTTLLYSSDASLWEAYARLNALVPGTQSMQRAAGCRQRQLRVLMTHTEWKAEHGAFADVAKATLEFSRAASASEDKSLQHAARLHLRSVMAQTEEDFAAEPGFSLLTEAKAALIS